MHFAKADKSERLKRVLALLSDYQEHTTMEIQIRARVTSATAATSELRRNGYNIPKARLRETKLDGTKIYVHQMLAF